MDNVLRTALSNFIEPEVKLVTYAAFEKRNAQNKANYEEWRKERPSDMWMISGKTNFKIESVQGNVMQITLNSDKTYPITPYRVDDFIKNVFSNNYIFCSNPSMLHDYIG